MVDNGHHQPDWIRAVMREASFRRGLILYGNVRDIFYDDQQRQYVTLPELLIRLFARDKSLGFTIAGVWDLVDGLRFPDDRTLGRFREAVSRGPGRAPATGRPAQAYDLGDGPRSDTPSTGLYADPAELFPAMRTVLASDTERPVFVLDWTHLLVSQPANPAPEERQWMLQVGKAMIGEPIVSMDSDHLRQSSGLIVLLTANLGSLPPILYQGDPRMHLIAVPSTTRPERHSFFLRHTDDLRCEQPRPAAVAAPAGAGGAGREDLADTLADLTDRLNLTDLRQILSLSLGTEAPVPSERLLNLYRFGDQHSPWEDLSEEKLRCVEETIKKRVVGQDPAVHAVATMIVRAYMGLSGLQHSARRSKPKGTLFFVGPTGVGKTELAKACAEFLFGDEGACIRFDMSEFDQDHSDQRLVGAPPGYVGFEEGGQLTNAVRQRPFCVLLFDEIEKAHGRVLDKFLQILEDGRLTDGRGETTYFSECVIIFTSNIGSVEMPGSGTPEDCRTHFVRAVEDHFVRKLGRPELLNRLGNNIVVLQPILDDSFRRAIMDKQLTPLHGYMHERFGGSLRLTRELEDHYLQFARSEHAGRGIGNALESGLLNPLAWFLLERKHQLRRGRTVSVTLNGDGPAFELQEA